MVIMDEQVCVFNPKFSTPRRVNQVVLNDTCIPNQERFTTGSKSKEVCRVAEHSLTVSFTYDFILSPIEDCRFPIDADRLRLHPHADFKGELYG